MIYNSIRHTLIGLWPTLVIIVVMLICVRLSYLFSHHKSFEFHDEFWKLMGIVYIILFYYLVTTVDINSHGGINLVPFAEITRYSLKSSYFVYNVLGNILLFVPLGYMVASYVKPKHCLTNIMIAIIISSTIEFVQLKIGRSFDVDDIILNTVGSLAGYLFYIGLNAIKNHLPDFIQSDWFNNLICIIISLGIVWYVLQIMGVNIVL